MMLLYAVLVPGTLVACEIALRLPLGRVLTTLRTTPRKAARVVGSKRISDDWKEKVLPRYAGQIMGASLLLFVCLIAIALPVIILASVVTGSLGAGSAALLKPLVLVEMIVLGAGYVALRRRLSR